MQSGSSSALGYQECQAQGKPTTSKLLQRFKTQMGIPLLLLNNAVAYKEKLSERQNSFQVSFSTNAPFIHFCNIYFVKKFWSQNQSFSREKPNRLTEQKPSCQQSKLGF